MHIVVRIYNRNVKYAVELSVPCTASGQLPLHN